MLRLTYHTLMCLRTFTCIGVVPVAGQIVRDLDGHNDKSASVLLVTIWELGEAAGPLLIAPLSELYGRWPVFTVANAIFIVTIVIAGLSESSSAFIFARFLSGLAVAGNALNPAIVGDLFKPAYRGTTMSLMMFAPLLGGAIGPAIGGAIVQSASWRHIMWMSAALAGAAELALLFLFKETYKVRILQNRATKLRKETGDDRYRSPFDGEKDAAGSPFWEAIVRPFQVFGGSVVLQILSLFNAICFSFFYIMSTTLPDILQDVYGYDSTLTGTCFIMFSVGSSVGVIITNLLLDRTYIYLSNKGDGKGKPEYRLPLLIIGAFALPAVVILYGFGAQYKWHIAGYLIVVGLLGVCLIMAMVPGLAYVVDAFGLHSASAMTAILITRNLSSTVFPLLTAPLVRNLGWGYGFLILAAVGFAVAPFPLILMRYGSQLRQRSKYSKDE